MEKEIEEKKLDILNLFYSLGAVVILVGVIAKLLEWEVQDIFMTVGLTMEAVVFGVSSIKFIKKEKKHKANNSVPLSEDLALKETAIPIEPIENFNSNKITEYSFPPRELYTNTENNNFFPQGESISFPQGESMAFPQKQILPPSMDSVSPDILWQLDKLGIISFQNEIFYQPIWEQFNDEDYELVTQLFFDLFGKKVVPRKNIPLLKSFEIRLPESGIGELVIDQPRVISNEQLQLLIQAFKPYRYKGFSDMFILYNDSSSNYIRTKKGNETQIFGGETTGTLNYCRHFFEHDLIISPALDFLKPFINLKDELLLDYLIKRLDQNNVDAIDLMCKALFIKSDQTKIYFLNKISSINYVQADSKSYSLIKSIVVLLMSISNKGVAKEILNRILCISIEDNIQVKLSDIPNMEKSGIQIGNERTFSLQELFNEVFLTSLKVKNTLVESLVTENLIDITHINELFEVSKVDSINILSKKFANYLNVFNVTPNSVQLEFSVLCKKALK